MNAATLREHSVGVAVTVRLQLCSSKHYGGHGVAALCSPPHAADLRQTVEVIH